MIVVRSPRHPRNFCPVSCVVPHPPEELEDRALIDESTGTPVPYQKVRAAGGTRIHWILDDMAARQRRVYRLAELRRRPVFSGVIVGPEEDSRLPVTVGKHHFTNYHFGQEAPRPFLYPVIGPFGTGVTRSYPVETVEGESQDHPHHRSVWRGWADVSGCDFWNEGEGCGRIVHSCFEEYHSGPVFGKIAALNTWLDAEGNKLMEDRTGYRFYNLPSSMRMLDVYVTLYPGDDQVRLGDTSEGGMLAVRVATALQANRGGRIENSSGQVNEAEAWGQRAGWCDCSGSAGGRSMGVAVFDHPANFRYPTYWHVRDCGLMAANPFGISRFLGREEADGSVFLPEGDTLRFRYRVCIHAGNAAEAGVPRKFIDWICPPEAKVEE